jgi:4'-phosphopantetheinyl transferase
MESEDGKNPTGNFGLEFGLQLWLAYPGDLADPAVEEACAALLDDAERARAARFRFARHRLEFVATHALTRVALSHAQPLPPHEWSFSVNKYGKPSPIPECGLRFNQSNSLELAVCLIARPIAGIVANPRAAVAEGGPAVGVDVESLARAKEIVPLAPRVFSAAERTQLDAMPDAQRPNRALSLWTLKEAYIKARGMGLSLPLDGISFLFDGPEVTRLENGPQAIRLEVAPGVDDEPKRWRFCRFDYAGHRIVLAVDADGVGPLEIFESRPPTGAPARLTLGSPAWFPPSATAGDRSDA